MQKDIKRFLYLDMLGLISGVIGGLGAVLFREMIKLNRFLFFKILLPLITVESYGLNFSIIILPALGGLIVGPIIYKYAPEAKGHGVPEVMEAVRLYGGRIRKRVAFIKIIVSSITIGSGGSAGREGPIAQIGASFGSLMGDILKLSSKERRLIVVSGLAAGIAGTFNAPLGGALFGLEVMFGGLTIANATAVILAAVVGAAIVRAIYGPYPAFYAPPHLTFRNPLELIFYFLLGLFLGIIAILWIKFFYFFEDFYDRLRIKNNFKTAIGGLFTGLVGFSFIRFGILGVGYEGIELVLAGEITAIPLLLLLAVLKMLSTANTIGSGGSGGVFAPSLFIGAMLGAAFGLALHAVFPDLVYHPITYALVGMGALFAGVAHAPLSMIIMIPEMTDDYSLLLPMMSSCATSYIVSKTFLGDANIYTLKLMRKGTRILIPDDISMLEKLKVYEFMTKDVISVTVDTPLSEVQELIRETHHDCYPVLDRGKLVGVISSDDILATPLHLLPKKTAKEIMRKNYKFIYDDDSILKVQKELVTCVMGKLLVVSRNNPRELRGIFTKTDLVKAYRYITML
ncbi:MAG: chloride channel protein [Candidatus Njordarchaeia archaeon]